MVQNTPKKSLSYSQLISTLHNVVIVHVHVYAYKNDMLQEIMLAKTHSPRPLASSPGGERGGGGGGGGGGSGSFVRLKCNQTCKPFICLVNFNKLKLNDTPQ